MWQGPAWNTHKPGNFPTYSPSYDAYFGFSGDKKEPSRSVTPFIYSAISHTTRTTSPTHKTMAAMKPNDTWIERGSDGRYYWVRKKSARSQLSFRHLLFEAL